MNVVPLTQSVAVDRPAPLARARALAPLIEAAAPQIEAQRCLPAPLLDALHAAGMFRLLLPRSQAGEEMMPADYVEVMEVLAGADASAAWCIGQACGCSMAAAYLSPEAAAGVFGRDSRAALAWGAGPAGRAVAVPGGWRVSGTWQFASGSRHATWLGGHCRIVEADGTTRLEAGRPIERTVLFPRARAAVTDAWQVMGLRGTGSDTYAVEDLFVPEDYALARDVAAERREPGLLYRFTSTNLYAAGFAGVALGIARAMLDAFIRLAQDKTPRDGRSTLRENVAVQMLVAQSEAKLRSARHWLLAELRAITAALAAQDALTLDQRLTIRLAATHASHMAREVADTAYAEAGASAIFDANPFERRFRDIHAVSQQMQARRSHLETVGAHLMGLHDHMVQL